MVVIGGSFINPLNFIPQGVKLDDFGNPVRSKYPSATQPFWLQDLGHPGAPGDSVSNRLVQQ